MSKQILNQELIDLTNLEVIEEDSEKVVLRLADKNSYKGPPQGFTPEMCLGTPFYQVQAEWTRKDFNALTFTLWKRDPEFSYYDFLEHIKKQAHETQDQTGGRHQGTQTRIGHAQQVVPHLDQGRQQTMDD